MFWGVTLESGKRYSQIVDTSYHLSMAALEPRQGGSSHKRVAVMLEHGKAEFLLCTLDHDKAFQVPLDLHFVEGEEVSFFLNGEGTVHLTGYLTDVDGLQDNDSSEEESASSANEEEDEDEDISTTRLMQVEEDDSEDSDFVPKEVATVKTSQKKNKVAKTSKKAVGLTDLTLANLGSDDDSSDEDFNEQILNGSAEEESDSDEASEDQDSDQDEEDEEPEPVKSATHKRKRKENKLPESAKPGKSSLSKASAAHDMSGTSLDSSAKKKRKRVRKESNLDNSLEATDRSQQGQRLHPGESGIGCQDLRVGSGPIAKKGKTMHVYYTGRLANNKEFDSCRSGKAFSFKLGAGEVIKGWDVGIQGMKVGGKRRLVVPPKDGYGNVRVGNIPPNSTLYFDVELKAIS